MKKKKQNQNTAVQTDDRLLAEIKSEQEVTLGSMFRVGRPVGATYDQIYLRLKDKSNAAVKLLPLNELAGSIFRVISIMKLTKDKIVIGLETVDKRPLYSGKNRVYAFLKESIESRELIRL